MHSQSPQRQQIQIKATAILMFGAPMAASGTAPAMDQGIMGAMTTTVFSRSRAKEDFSGLFSPHSWLVSMMARVWLQEMAEVTMEVSKVVP